MATIEKQNRCLIRYCNKLIGIIQEAADYIVHLTKENERLRAQLARDQGLK